MNLAFMLYTVKSLQMILTPNLKASQAANTALSKKCKL